MLTVTNKPDLMQILEATRNGVQSGSISVKDVTKSLSQINETLSRLDTFIEEISTFNKSKNDLERKLSVFNVEKLKQKEYTLSRHQNEKSTLEAKIKTFENEITEIIESIPKHIKSTESMLNNISGVQYSIRPE